MTTAAQRLLLRAALGEGADALEAWQAWRAATVIDALDPDSQWLLPLLYRHLLALGVPRASLTRYERVYRHNWYKNHLTLTRVVDTMRTLERDGYAPVLAGSAALAVGTYADLGARPLASVRIQIDRPLHTPVDPPENHSPITICAAPAASAGDAAMPIRTVIGQWAGRNVTLVHPVDQLLAIAAQRDSWDPRSSLLWIADVVTITQRHASADWHAIVDAASCDQPRLRETLHTALALAGRALAPGSGTPVTADPLPVPA